MTRIAPLVIGSMQSNIRLSTDMNFVIYQVYKRFLLALRTKQRKPTDNGILVDLYPRFLTTDRA